MFNFLGVTEGRFLFGDFELEINTFLAIIIITTLFILPCIFFRNWFFYRRRITSKQITNPYKLPIKLTPAELSYIFNGKLHGRELGATIVDLAKRGLIHIKSVDGVKRVFAGPKLEDNLEVYEKILITRADIETGIDAKKLLESTKANNGFVLKFFKIHSSELDVLVADSLRGRGFIYKTSVWKYLKQVIVIYLIATVFLFVIPLILIWIKSTMFDGVTDVASVFGLIKTGLIYGIYFTPLILTLSSIVVNLRGKLLGRPWVITKELERYLPQIVSFRHYIHLTETEKLKFSDPEMQSLSKKEILAYSIAFGYVKNWRKIVS